AALPMITGAPELRLSTWRRAGADPASADISGFEPPLRAESAAKGEIFVPREGEVIDVARPSEMTEGRLAGRAAELTPVLPATSLSNCSIGRSRCACAIFKSPSSR